MDQERFENTKKSVGAVVAMALIVVAFINGVGDGITAGIQHAKLEAGAEDYLDFAKLYQSTFLLSATLTAAIAIYFVPPLFGTRVHWVWPLFVITVGGYLTGTPIPAHSGTPWGDAFASLQTFAIHYGVSFVGGVAVGTAGGLIVYTVCKNYRS